MADIRQSWTILFGALFSIQGRITRVAGNHQIQSPGGDICKEVQSDIWDLQPKGIHPLLIRCLNSHDEILTVSNPSLPIQQIVIKSIERLWKYIPLLEMEFDMGLNNWGEKK